MFLSPIFRLPSRTITPPLRHATRSFGIAPITAAQMPPRPIVPESDIWESFLKGSGPGGQKIVRPPSPTSKQTPLTLIPGPTNPRSPAKEQNLLRRATKAPPLRPRRQIPSHTLALSEPEDRAALAGGEAGGCGEGAGESDGDEGGGEEEEEGE